MSKYTKEIVMRTFIGESLNSAIITKHIYDGKLDDIDLELNLGGDMIYFSTSIKALNDVEDLNAVEELSSLLNTYRAEVQKAKLENI